MFKLGPFTLDLTLASDAEFGDLRRVVEAEHVRRNGPATLDIAESCMVRCGQHIQAIKAYRARTGVGLRDAKDACDAFRAEIPDYKAGRTSWSDTENRWVYPQNRW